MNYQLIFSWLMSTLLLIHCQSETRLFDATGTFEADEVIVSAETPGKIIAFDFREGSKLPEGVQVVQMDTGSLHLEKEQVISRIEAVKLRQNQADPEVSVYNSRLEAANARISTLQTRLKTSEVEWNRLQKLYDKKAATDQQLDQMKGNVDVLQDEIAAAKAEREVIATNINALKEQVKIQNRGITSEISPLLRQIDILNDQLKKSRILNPAKGTLLVKYANAGEFVNVGNPLYKLADLSRMRLRAYIDGGQMAKVRLGQKVSVFIDESQDSYREYKGTISWIASQAEFTPKTIQTRDERANLVYAIDVDVANDGYLKIGMYGEVAFTNCSTSE